MCVYFCCKIQSSDCAFKFCMVIHSKKHILFVLRKASNIEIWFSFSAQILIAATFLYVVHPYLLCP